MEIHLPKEIEHYEPELRFFFDAMVRKLHVNRHKGFGEGMELDQMMGQLADETKELKIALGEESQFATFMECVDVSNQAWLLGLVVLRQTKVEFEGQRNYVKQNWRVGAEE